MTNTSTNMFVVNPFDWTRTITLAHKQARHEFETTVLHEDGFSDDQLYHHAEEFERRFRRALEAAKHHRHDPEPMFLAAMRNWAGGKAIGLLREKQAGKAIRKDYYEVFESALKEEIAYQIAELEQTWQSQDDQQQQQAAVDRRAEQEQAFQDDHRPLIEAYTALERAYTGREKATQAGYDLAGQFADTLEKRMERHEHYLETMGGEVLGMIRDVHVQQRRENTLSLTDQIVRTGKHTLTCLFWLVLGGLVVFFGIFAALYFAFPHH